MATPGTFLPPEEADKLLADVADRNAPLLLESRGDGDPVVYRSRFLGADRGGEGSPDSFWIDQPVHAVSGQPIEAADGQCFNASFNVGRDQFRFLARVAGRGQFLLAGGVSTAGLRIRRPSQIERIQRRQCYRHQIGREQSIEVLVWPGGLKFAEQAARGKHSSYRGRLVDVSVGGLCVRLPPKVEPKFEANEALGVQFALEGCTIRCDAALRRQGRDPAARVELGVEFIGLEKSLDGRRTLAQLSQIITALQRRSLRRHRVGLE